MIFIFIEKFKKFWKCMQRLWRKNCYNFNNRHRIIYSDFDFKWLFVCEHILIDKTFVYPDSFSQNIIISYYDVITYKFISAVYILIN